MSSLTIIISAAAPVAAQAVPGSWVAPANVEMAHPDQDGSSVLWVISSAAGTMSHVQRGNTGEPTDTYGYTGSTLTSQTMCTGQDVTLNNLSFSANADFDSTLDVVTGDYVITGTGTWAGLSDEVQIRLFGEGDLMRTSHLLTNNTASPITITWKMHHDATDVGVNGDQGNVATSTGDNTWDANDIWAGVYGPDPGQMVYSYFWATPDLLTTASTSFTDNVTSQPVTSLPNRFYGDQTFNTFTVAPGARYQLMWFNSNVALSPSDDTPDGRLAALNTAVAEFGDWEWGVHDRSARGIDVTIAGNWREGHYNPGANSKASLADTGVNLDGAWVALGLIVAAGGAFAIRRRIRTAR